MAALDDDDHRWLIDRLAKLEDKVDEMRNAGYVTWKSLATACVVAFALASLILALATGGGPG